MEDRVVVGLNVDGLVCMTVDEDMDCDCWWLISG